MHFFAEHPDVIQALQLCVNALISSCKKQEDVAEAHKILLASMTELNPLKLTEEFDESHLKYRMYTWAKMYMRQVTAMLQFISSIHICHTWSGCAFGSLLTIGGPML